MRLRRQHRIYAPACPLRLWVVLDETALRRVVGSPDIMREQLEHLNALSDEPHITVQVLPYAVGAHPGLSGQFSILRFAGNTTAGVVYLERFTSDLYLEKASDVQGYGVMYDHVQAQALDPDRTRRFITDVIKSHIDATWHTGPHSARQDVRGTAGPGGSRSPALGPQEAGGASR